MSVYIKGMEMPKDGCHHIVCIYADGTVSTGRREYTAVPVPPHGRLIDANKLTYVMGMDERFSVLDALYLMGVIDDAPTIIPEEEGE